MTNITKLLTIFLLTFAIALGTFSLANTASLAQEPGLTLTSFNPFGSANGGGGIKCLYYIDNSVVTNSRNNSSSGNDGSQIQSNCTNASEGLLNRAESLLLIVAPAIAVIAMIRGGYMYIQEGYQDKAKGLEYVKGSIVGLVVIYSAWFIRNTVFTVTTGLFGNNAGSNASGLTATNPGVETILNLIKFVITNVMIPIAIPIAVFFVILNGYRLLTAAGDVSKTSKAVKGIVNSLIGLAVIFGAIAIVAISQGLITGFFRAIPSN